MAEWLNKSKGANLAGQHALVPQTCEGGTSGTCHVLWQGISKRRANYMLLTEFIVLL